jgi:hypothetical protein
VNRQILNFIIFIFVFSLLISDWALIRFGIPSQVYLFIPLILVCITRFHYNHNLYATCCILFYGLILVLNGLTATPDNLTLVMYRYFGNALVLFILMNNTYSDTILERGMRYYYVLCCIIGACFYLGLWEIVADRYTFIQHNSNGISHLMSLGILIGLFYLFQAKNAKEKYWLLFMITMMTIPTILTISRANISAVISMLLIFSVFRYKRNALVISLVGIVGIVLFALVNLDDINNSTIQTISNRFNEAKDDPRHEWRRKGVAIINDNQIYGVGYDNYFSEDWMFENGFFRERAGEFTVASIHNGYVDLGLLGGYPLILSYLLFTVPWLIYGIKYYFSGTPNKKIQATGIFFISTFYVIFITTYIGQANYGKTTWWLLAICFVLLEQTKKQEPEAIKKPLAKEDLHKQIAELARG